MAEGQSPADGASALVDLGPGRGGVSRGRGDADMIWGAESPGRTDEFAPKQLPGGRQLDPDQSALLGVAAAAPEVEPQADSAGSQATAAAEARSAWRRRLAPAHREAVKRFFAPADDGKRR